MSDSSKKLIVYLLLAITVIAVYWPVTDHQFINFDDDLYVTDNQQVKSGLTIDGIIWAFQFNDRGYWQPLTWISHMLDCELAGVDPAWHHFHNLMIHLVNSVLLFFLFYQLSGGFYRSLLIAAIFAVHPLNVDSVAWIAERKNLLSTFFWILSLLLYKRYTDKANPSRYALVLTSFLLGLMVKPMLVTLPFVFFMLDFWPLNRTKYDLQPSMELEAARSDKAVLQPTAISKLAIEKIPFLVLSLGSVCLSILSTRQIGEIVSVNSVPMTLRLGNALVSYVKYAGKMIWPFNLAVYYPFPDTMPMWSSIGAAILLAAVSALCLRFFLQKPYLTVGWFWYLGTLVPVIGIVQGGLWPAMADRWSYVPLIGLFIITVWGIADIAEKWRKGKPLFALVAISIIAFFSITARVQLQHWENSAALFEHALAVTENNYVAHNNLGNALSKEWKLLKATEHYRESIRLKPNHAKAFNNLGIALAKQGKIKDAIRQYSEAIRLNSGYAQAYNNLGAALTEHGQIDNAIHNYELALKLKPDYAEAHNNLGVALKKHGRITEAAKHYYKASFLDPDYAAPHYNLGLAYFQFGKIKKSIYHFQKALMINPSHRDAQKSLKLAQKIKIR
jgi:tetratricopeptide (TPR) repeat protein